MDIAVISGIINLDKPAGLTSTAVTNRVKRLLPEGVKIGHAGTLDPFATGVLLLLIGVATRKCEMLMDQEKEYEAIVKLGETTKTDDCESEPAPVHVAEVPTIDALRTAIAQFVGIIPQRPPAFSAKWVKGRRAYDLARRGHSIELPPKNVLIKSIDLLDYQWPTLSLRITCGRGTYIRAIARDLGEILGTGGHLTALRRTRIGIFSAAAAVSLQTLTVDGIEPHLQLWPAHPEK